MNDIKIDELNAIIKQASQTLSNSQQILHDLIKDKQIVNIEEAQRLLLILSYRLDTQDALIKILQIDHGLLQILGIAPQHSIKVNLERMNFALGHDDLQKMLHTLSILLHSLLQTAQKNQKTQNKPTMFKKNALKANLSKFELRLQKATQQQKKFIELIETLGAHLYLWYQKEAIGPVLDHIASLHGPISRFYQALQNGLSLIQKLHEKTYQDIQLDKTLTTILKQTNLILTPLPSIKLPHPFFSPSNVSEERLQQRAKAKRLGNFFNH